MSKIKSRRKRKRLSEWVFKYSKGKKNWFYVNPYKIKNLKIN